MRKHYVVWQKTQEVDSKYANNTLNSEIGEDHDHATDPRRTMYNPDLLPESSSPYFIHENQELTDNVRDLVSKAKKILSKPQWKVFNLLTGWQGQPPMTQKDAALSLGITQGRVSQIWEEVRQLICQEWEK